MQFRQLAVTVAVTSTLALSGCGGEGINAKLDASQGYDGNYHATLAKAFLGMTQKQKEAYNWVVENLDANYFVAYYGKNPRVLDVIIGQLDRFEQNNNKALNEKENEAKQYAEAISERKALQEKARAILASINATGTSVKRTDSSAKCQGLACSDAGQTVWYIDYTVSNPQGLLLSRYECKAKVTNPDWGGEYWTINLPQGCARSGSYQHKVNWGDDNPKDFTGAKVVIEFDEDSAQMSGTYEQAIPADVPVVAKIKELEQIRSIIATYRKTI